MRAVGRELAITAGAPAAADLVITADDTRWHALLSGGLSPAKALRARQVTVDGDPALLDTLISLFAFPGRRGESRRLSGEFARSVGLGLVRRLGGRGLVQGG